MYGLKLRNLASVFLDAQSITASSKEMSRLLEMLSDLNLDVDFLPVSVTEARQEGPPVPRLAFMSHDQEWRLVLLGDRFNFSQDYVGEDSSLDSGNVGTINDFLPKAAAVLAPLVSHFGRRGHRMAVVQEGFLPNSSTDKEHIRSKLLQLPPLYQEHHPFEWNWRAVAAVDRSFGSQHETTNTITKVDRIAGSLSSSASRQIEFDMIRVDLDVNTEPSNVEARFSEDRIRDFLEASSQWHRDLEQETVRFLGIAEVGSHNAD